MFIILLFNVIVARKLIEAHGGDIGVYSDGQAQGGSTFFVDVPIVEGHTNSLSPVSLLPLVEGNDEYSPAASGKSMSGKCSYEEEGYTNIFDIEKPSSAQPTPNVSSKSCIPAASSVTLSDKRLSRVSFSDKGGGSITIDVSEDEVGTQLKPQLSNDSLSVITVGDFSKPTSPIPSPSFVRRSLSMHIVATPQDDEGNPTDGTGSAKQLRSKSTPRKGPLHHAHSFSDIKALSQARHASRTHMSKPRWSSVLLVDDCIGIRKITARSLSSNVDIDIFEEVRVLRYRS